MTATYTDGLRLTKQGVGDNDGTWGTILNTVLDLVDESVSGQSSISVSGGTNITLTTANGSTDQARKMSLSLTGATIADMSIVVPSLPKLYAVKVGFTGTNTVTIKTVAGVGVGLKYYGTTSVHMVYCDGADVFEVSVPQGVLNLWSGTIATIPSGYVLCNGSNSTPDLRDKFVVGAKQDDTGVAKTNLTGSLTQTGGNYSTTTSVAGSHSHTGVTGDHTLIETEIPSHKHYLFGDSASSGSGIVTNDIVGKLSNGTSENWDYRLQKSTGATANTGLSGATGGSQAHSHTISTEAAHSHSFTTEPPYYALAYIMRA